MSKYYLVRDDKSFKYERFVIASSHQEAEQQWSGYIVRDDAPPEFVPPYCPYLRDNNWTVLKGPETHYILDAFDVENSNNRWEIKENSIYEVEGTPQNVYLTLPAAYLKESSIFFTLSDDEEHNVSVTSSTGETIHLVGSTDYWVSGKSYILTVYNNYVIIGVAKINE